MQIDWFTFIAQVINFLILIALLQRFLFKPVIKAMEEREKKITNELEGARLKKVEAEQKERQLQQELDDFESEKGKLMQQAREEVGDRRKAWMDELRTEISEVRRRWMEALESEKESFLKHLTEETGNEVVKLIEKVLVDLSERNLQQQTVDFFFQKLGELDPKEINQLKKTVRNTQKPMVEVLSTFELSQEHKDKVVGMLNEITGTDPAYKFNISPELGFGLEIHVAGWRLGWNLKSYLEGMKSDMDRYLEANIPLENSTEL